MGLARYVPSARLQSGCERYDTSVDSVIIIGIAIIKKNNES